MRYLLNAILAILCCYCLIGAQPATNNPNNGGYMQMRGQTATPAQPPVTVNLTFTGSGLNDCSGGAAYTQQSVATFSLTINGTGSPNTFNWTETGGSNSSGSSVSITGAAQTLADGFQVTFGATTGHTNGDNWSFVVQPQAATYMDSNGALMAIWSNGTTIAASSHNLLSATHADTTPASAVRGDLIVAQTASPLWKRLALDGANRAFINDGTDSKWGKIDVSSSSYITGIMAAVNGGTNNAFFAVSGPTTSTKTFTFPDASTTVLTNNVFAAKGDLIAATGSGASAILTVGANSKGIVADSTQSTGIKWATIDLVGDEQGTNSFTTGDGTEQTAYSYSVPANSLGATGNLKLKIQIGLKRVASSTSTFVIKMKFGGTLIFQSPSLSVNANTTTWQGEMFVGNSATNTNFATATLIGVGATNSTTAASATTYYSATALGVDCTASQTVLVTVTETLGTTHSQFAAQYGVTTLNN